MLIKAITLKLYRYIKSPNRIEKAVETMGFHKRCEYHQRDIERLFKDGFFDLKDGSMTYDKDWQGRIRGKPKIIIYGELRYNR